MEQRVEIGARWQGDIGRLGRASLIGSQGGFDGGTFKTEDRSDRTGRLGSEPALCPHGIGNKAERQLATGKRLTQRAPGIIARLPVDVAAQQRDPQGAIHAVGKINDAASGNGQAFVECQAGRCRPAIGGIEQAVVVDELLGW